MIVAVGWCLLSHGFCKSGMMGGNGCLIRYMVQHTRTGHRPCVLPIVCGKIELLATCCDPSSHATNMSLYSIIRKECESPMNRFPLEHNGVCISWHARIFKTTSKNVSGQFAQLKFCWMYPSRHENCMELLFQPGSRELDQTFGSALDLR